MARSKLPILTFFGVSPIVLVSRTYFRTCHVQHGICKCFQNFSTKNTLHAAHTMGWHARKNSSCEKSTGEKIHCVTATRMACGYDYGYTMEQQRAEQRCDDTHYTSWSTVINILVSVPCECIHSLNRWVNPASHYGTCIFYNINTPTLAFFSCASEASVQKTKLSFYSI